MDHLLRRVRGAIGNAALWAASWFGISVVAWTGLLLGGVFGAYPEPWTLVLMMSAQSGLSGFTTGLLFSAYLRFAHRDSSILAVGVVRSALAGAGIAALLPLSTTLIWFARTGFPFNPALLVVGAAPAMVFGALTAGGTVALARQNERASIEHEQRKAFGLVED